MPGPTDDDQPLSFDLELGDDTQTSRASSTASADDVDASSDANSTPRGSGLFRQVISDRAPRPRPKRMITELYGKSARGGPNVTAAAEATGRHPSTIRRWIKNGLPKRSGAGDQLRAAWQDSPPGRKASMSPARRRAIESRTSPVGGSVTGKVQMDTDDIRNGLSRTFNYTISADAARRMSRAIMAGDDALAHSIFEDSLQGFGTKINIDIDDLGMNL